MTKDEYMDRFNEGKEIEVSSRGYEDTIIKVVDCKIIQPNKEEDALYLQFLLDVGGRKEERSQRIFINEDGNIANPLLPRRIKDDIVKPASLAFDIWQGIKKYLIQNNNTSEYDRLNSIKGFSKQKFIGQKFVMGVKTGERKDGNGEYLILETDYQKYKDEEYRRERE